MTEATVKLDMFPDEVFNVSGKYYYSKKHKINPEWYQNFAEANFYEIIKIGKGIQL